MTTEGKIVLREKMGIVDFKHVIETTEGYKPYWASYRGRLDAFLLQTPPEEWTKSFHAFEAWFDHKGLTQIRDISPAFFRDFAHHHYYEVQDDSLVFLTIPGSVPYEMLEAI